MRIAIVVLLLVFFGCENDSNYSNTYNLPKGEVKISKTLNLLDMLSGNPDGGGCWVVDSIPTGSILIPTLGDTIKNDNPAITFD